MTTNDLNLVIISGRLAAPPEFRVFDSGARYCRFLVTTRSEKRVDVVPVTLWDYDDDHELTRANPGDRLWVAAQLQRRFWSAGEGRRSRLEIVANHAEVRDTEEVYA